MKVPLRALSLRGQRTESCCQIDGFSPNVSPAEGQRVRLLCAIRHFLFLSFSYADRKRPRKRKRRRDKTREEPARPGGRKWYKIMKRSNGTCCTSRGAVGRPRPPRGAAMPVISRTRATGPERNDPSRDEAGSSAAIKKGATLITHVRAPC